MAAVVEGNRLSYRSEVGSYNALAGTSTNVFAIVISWKAKRG